METQNSQNWLETRQKRNKANSSQEANEDQKSCSQGILLIGEKKTTERNIPANARMPSAATENIP